jgi:predicted DCC family thiol-disulfide oxidoreductase YuxK
MVMDDSARPIFLFDGVCNFCNDGVNYIIRHDPEGRFRFASLQSDAGKALLEKHGLRDLPLSTMVLIDGDRAYTNSDGVLRTARRLGGVYALVVPLLLVPRPLRDWAYHLFANNRYRMFGQADQCMAPTPEVRQRFLDMT